jgi:hypothetical protein
MATVGRKKRKRKPGARTGVSTKGHTRSPRGPDTKGGKRKPAVRVDSYQRGKPKKKGSSSSSKRKGSTRRRKKKR